MEFFGRLFGLTATIISAQQDMSVPWGLLPSAKRDQLRRNLDWERYLAEARALGYTEREARLVAAGVSQVAKKTALELNILSEAAAVLAATNFNASQEHL